VLLSCGEFEGSGGNSSSRSSNGLIDGNTGEDDDCNILPV